MATIKIAGREIGQGCPPFLIAEAGINHNGELEKAFRLIRLAKEAGADAVKFQTFKAAELCGDPKQAITYRSQGKKVTEPLLGLLKRNELSRRDWGAVKRRCDKEGILFLSTPQNRSDLDLLIELGAPAIKVGSDDFTHLPQLRDFAASGLPMIVSSGMCDLSEIYQSLKAIGALDGYPTVLLLCTSQYPTPPKDVNLLKLQTLSRAFPMVPVGFSDHTQGPLASSLAAALGACVLEKHFTLDRGLPGPDHWFSEDSAGLREWVASVRTVSAMLGSGVVRSTQAEEAMKGFMRRSIMALKDIKPGEVFNGRNVGLMRPGTGLPPLMIEHVLGRKATRGLAKGALLKFGDFA